MRIICLCITLLFTATLSFAQQTEPAEPRSVELNLKRSKTQRTVASILLGCGLTTLALTATDAALSKSVEGTLDFVNGVFGGEPLEHPKRSYAVPLTIGAASIVGSIALFDAASKNKKRALGASTHLKIERYPALHQNQFTSNAYPTLALKLKL